jgi:hypothetical protein
MRDFFAKKYVQVILLHVGILAVVSVLFTLLSWAFDSACPTYAIFGICCPFCGMTRAHLAALRLDFAAAFAYHPAFFAGVPFLWMLFHKGLFQKKWALVLWWVLSIGLGALLLGTYMARVIIHGGFDFFA